MKVAGCYASHLRTPIGMPNGTDSRAAKVPVLALSKLKWTTHFDCRRFLPGTTLGAARCLCSDPPSCTTSRSKIVDALQSLRPVSMNWCPGRRR